MWIRPDPDPHHLIQGLNRSKEVSMAALFQNLPAVRRTRFRLRREGGGEDVGPQLRFPSRNLPSGAKWDRSVYLALYCASIGSTQLYQGPREDIMRLSCIIQNTERPDLKKHRLTYSKNKIKTKFAYPRALFAHPKPLFTLNPCLHPKIYLFVCLQLPFHLLLFYAQCVLV